MKQCIVLGTLICCCNAMHPPKQVSFADEIPKQSPSYTQLSQEIINSPSTEPLFFDICLSCASCPVSTAASVSFCPQASFWCHLGVCSITFCAFLASWTRNMPEGSASEQMVAKIKKDASCVFKKNCKKNH